MKPNEFVEKYLSAAQSVERETGIPAVAILAQAALESGWGGSVIGNNFFGIKFKKGDPGFRRFLTTEYSDDRFKFRGQDVKEVRLDRTTGKYVFKIYQYFAEYPTPEAGFKAHTRLLLSDRYKHALRWKHSPKRFLIAVWRAGYATDPNYGKKICQMVDSVVRRLPVRQTTFMPPPMKPITDFRL